MSTVISATAPAPIAQTAVENRRPSHDDSRFGAELDSAKAAINPSSAAPDAPVSPAADSASADASARPAAKPATAATAAAAAAQGDASSTTAVAAPTVVPSAAAATAQLTAITLPADVSAAADPAQLDPAAATVVASPSTVAPQSTAAVSADSTAGAAVNAAASTPVVVPASTTGSLKGAPKKALTDDAALDTSASAVVASVVAPPVQTPVVAPLASASAGADPAEPQPQISVASAAASGPMLVAAATEKQSPKPDAPPVVVDAGPATTAVAPTTIQGASVASVPTAPDTPRPVDQPIAIQLAKPVAALRAAGDGTHVITIAVTPENLGPVTVRAHVSGDAIRIELVAPTEQSREALKAIMPDLRRDLSQSGGQLSLDLSSGNQPSGRESFGESTERSRARDFDLPTTAASPIRTPSMRTDSALDVLV